jgi:hypothetical protein
VECTVPISAASASSNVSTRKISVFAQLKIELDSGTSYDNPDPLQAAGFSQKATTPHYLSTMRTLIRAFTSHGIKLGGPRGAAGAEADVALLRLVSESSEV